MTHRKLALLAAADSMGLDTDGPLLFAALDSAGVDYEVVAWDDHTVTWRRYHTVVLRATWDYFRRVDEFLGVLENISQTSTLLNPLEVVQWNIDKRYLGQLETAGAPVVRSCFVSHLSPPTELGAALAQVSTWGSDNVVVKPTVSAGSNDTFRFDATDGSAVSRAVQAIVDSDRVAMIQPYVSAIDSYGERGCVYINGELDHAFAKAALLKPGSENITGLLPEDIGAVELMASERAVAEQANSWLRSTFGTLLYARIDLLPAEDGPVVGEVEVIEPSLFFEADPPSAVRFAAALAALG